MKKGSILSKIRENFDLNGVTEVHFWKSEWEAFDPHDRLTTVSYGYLIFRFAFMAYFLITLIEDFMCSKHLSLFFIFLTNITYIVQTIYSVLFFTAVVLARINQRKVLREKLSSAIIGYNPIPKLPWLEKFVWIFMSIVNTIPFGVSMIYWIFLFKGDKGKTCEIVSNYFVHASNSVLSLIDNLIVAVPTRVTHAVFPMIYAFCYLLFTGLYEVGGGAYEGENEYIYNILNWKNKAGQALGVSVGGIIFAGAGHLVFGWGVYRLRVHLVHKFMKKNLNVDFI